MPPDRQKLRIFVVDDEWVIASTLATILKHSGFDAVSFTDPLDALRAGVERAPNLLITDVMMPQMSGIELAIQMRAQSPECKVLLFSGQAATRDLLDQARRDGHDFELLAKPIHPKDFVEKIKDLHSVAG